jgi:hypothetical protein
MNSQIKHQSGDLLRIRSCDGAESNQGIKVDLMVAATTIFGHRSLLRQTLLRRTATVYIGWRNQSAREMTDGLGRSASSPGTRRGAREGRGRSESPASLVTSSARDERERRIPSDWGRIGSIPLARMHPSSSPVTRDEQRDFGRPLATARKLDRS